MADGRAPQSPLQRLAAAELAARPGDDFVARVAWLAGVPLLCGACGQAGRFIPAAPTKCSVCQRTRGGRRAVTLT